MKQNYLYICWIFLLLSLGVHAQMNPIASNKDRQFKEAQLFYQQAKYGLAYAMLKDLYSLELSKKENQSLQFDQITYYYLLTGLLVKDPEVALKTIRFIQTTNQVAYQSILSFQLANYYFDKQDYQNALVYFEQAKIEHLANAEIAKLKFSSAYCYFVQNDFKKAKPLFNIIRQISNDPNYTDANYYYGFIAFKENAFNEAIDCFKNASNNASLMGVIPFYLSQIFYFTGDTEKSLLTAKEALLNKDSPYQLLLEQLVGHLYYERKEYEQAIPYLTSYHLKSKKVNRQDVFELGVSYYFANQFDKASVELAKLIGLSDSLAYHSTYLLASSYLKLGDKEKARSAFQICANNSHQTAHREIALFNYSKLSFELGFAAVALENLNKFMNHYPQSIYMVEAKEVLVNLLANANDYLKALDLYESLAPKTDQLTRIYPGILFGAAVSYFNNSQFEKSDSLFDRLMGVPYHQKYLSATHFWKGELSYRKNNFTETVQHLTHYLSNPIEMGDANISNANYTLGYAYFHLANFSLAKTKFQLVGDQIDLHKIPLMQDVFLRIADCYFMQKEYASAMSIYQKYIDQSLQGADYASFQKAMILGAKNKQPEKIEMLQSIERLYPKSPILLNANQEMANTFLADENYLAAIPVLQNLANHPNPSIVTGALLKLGIAYFNSNQLSNALQQFTSITTHYPNAEESVDAIAYLRNIYLEQNQPELFANHMKVIGKPITVEEEDSLLYRSAHIRSQSTDKVDAVNLFMKYLDKFPNGHYCLEANYYLATFYHSAKRMNEALSCYQIIADKFHNKYAEEASISAARILYFQLKNYETAEKYFSIAKQVSTSSSSIRLEAMKGLLRCQFKRQAWDMALPNAEELLLEKGVANDDKMMAYLVLAKTAYLKGDFINAMKYYHQIGLGSKNEISAEAKYYLSLIYFSQNQLAIAEKNAFDLVKQFADFEFWVTKGYLLLGDIYLKKADWFNAEATFSSIAANSVNDDFVKEAKEKLTIVFMEKQKQTKIE